MQSLPPSAFLHHPGGPLSPSSSSLFAFDGKGSNGSNQDGSDDLFRYYLDVQAFGSSSSKDKDQLLSPSIYNGMNSNMNNGSASNNNYNPHPYASMDDTIALSPSPSSASSSSTAYNAFFNPALYANATARNNTSIQDNNNEQSSASLFPFADAASSNNNTFFNDARSSASLDPSTILSSSHLAGSEDPLQPINPSLLLMGSGGGQSYSQYQHQPTSFSFENIPVVKLEEDSANVPQEAYSNTRAQQEDSNDEMEDDQDEAEEEDSEDDDDEDISLASVAAKTSNTRSSGTAPSNKRSAAAPPSKKKGNSTTTSKASTKKSTSSTSRSSRSVKESSVVSSISHYGGSGGGYSGNSNGGSGSNGGGHNAHPHALVPVPEWEDRLSKQEYDKLSSKEKRQMRNKISARNFRHRRKAHIDTLEAVVEEKESVISVLREEVGTLRTENSGLRADIEMLKKNWESIAAKISASTIAAPMASISNAGSNMTTDLQQLSPDEDDLYGAPGSLPALSPAASTSEGSTNGDVHSELSFEQQTRRGSNSNAQAQASASTTGPSSTSSGPRASGPRVTRSAAIRPNFRKDVGPSGTSFSSSFGGGRAMNVHTTLVPELTFNFPVPPPSVASYTSNTSTTVGTGSNPNGDAANSSASSTTSSSGSRASSPPSSTGQLHHSIAEFLAGKKDRDVSQQSAQQQQRMNMNPALNGLTPDQIANLREQFFNSTSSSTMPSMNSNNNNAQIASGKIAQRGAMGGLAPLDPLQQSFFDANPFLSLRQDNLQDYRAQLYAKLANNVAGIQAQQQLQQQVQQQQGSGGSKNVNTVNGLRPAFFSNQVQAATPESTTEMATIATIAQKTLFDKLSSAFWDAFTGTSPATQAKSMIPPHSPSRAVAGSGSSSTSAAPAMDGQKVADVLAGRSRFQIVKNEEHQDHDVDELVNKIDSLGLKK